MVVEELQLYPNIQTQHLFISYWSMWEDGGVITLFWNTTEVLLIIIDIMYEFFRSGNILNFCLGQHSEG